MDFLHGCSICMGAQTALVYICSICSISKNIVCLFHFLWTLMSLKKLNYFFYIGGGGGGGTHLNRNPAKKHIRACLVGQFDLPIFLYTTSILFESSRTETEENRKISMVIAIK